MKVYDRRGQLGPAPSLTDVYEQLGIADRAARGFTQQEIETIVRLSEPGALAYLGDGCYRLGVGFDLVAIPDDDSQPNDAHLFPPHPHR